MDQQQVIHVFAGIGGVSSIYLGWQVARFILTKLADRRDAKAASMAAAESREDALQARLTELERLVTHPALPPPSVYGGQGGPA